ncbi:beta-1,3-galactosyltransferase 4-like [Hypanus sabinus]|uniref:beta-1,3-galactosyltransferase 4-like n=1 Tax=Hypanus sabinus TaxID=79690 RepID=UPI0028C4F88E|nr:beta-1,3-galactosyltransferase 4-like [Hypanus sabinus]
MRCLLGRRRLPWPLHHLLPLALALVLLLLITLLQLGPIEEWVQSPGGEEFGEMANPGVPLRPAAGTGWAPGSFQLPNLGACTGSRPVFLVTLVASSPGHRHQRQAIRDSWGSLAEAAGRRVRTLFALGLPATPREARLLEAEAQRHGDLVQGLFTDTYLNLTLKTLMVLDWVREHCPDARFVLKADDDVFVNVRALVTHLAALSPPESEPEGHPRSRSVAEPDLYLGRIHASVRVERDPDSPYYVPEAAYPAPTYPRYCSGTAYVLSRGAAAKVLAAAHRLPLVRVEDAFIGMCARAAGLSPTPSARMAGAQRLYPHRCCLRRAFSSHHVSPAELSALWLQVEEGGECGTLQGLAARLICNSVSLLDQLRYHWAGAR